MKIARPMRLAATITKAPKPRLGVLLVIAAIGLAIALFAQISPKVRFISGHTPTVYAADQTVPYAVNFQGRLTDQNGNIMPDGTYNMKFRLYNASTGGTLEWEGDYLDANSQGVTLNDGLFGVQLGSVNTTGTINPALFANNENLYLEVELPTPATATTTSPSWTEGPMTPRQPLASVPYAMNADTIDGIDSTQLARTDVGNTFSGNNTFSNNLTVSGSTTLQGLTVAGASSLAGLTASGNATIQGGSLTLGTTSQGGSLALYANGHAITLQGNSAQANSVALSIPADTNATDSLCLVSLGNCTGANGGSGDGNYIENETTLQAAANFNISGTGIAATLQGNTSVLTPTLDTATAVALNVGTTTASSVNVGRTGANTTITGGNIDLTGNTVVMAGDTLDVQSGYASITGLNVANSHPTLTLDNHSSGASPLVVESSDTAVLTVANGGAVSLQNTTNSSTAFQVQDAAGESLLGVDTGEGTVTVDGTGGYTVGQAGPGGGTIFYDKGNDSDGWEYLEFAPSTWDGGSDPTAEWCNGYEGAAIETGDSTTYGPTGNQDIGQGAANTATMLANSNCTAGAAHLASGYTGGGYSDWFLPSVAELTEIYDYYNSNGDAGGFASDGYWSSSEYSSARAWYVGFSDGDQTSNGKTYYGYVRPIREVPAPAFQVQDAAGDDILTVDTVNGQVVFGSGSIAGALVLQGSGGFSGTIELAGGMTNNTTYLLPVVSAASVTLCTSAGNCIPNGSSAGDILYWNGSAWVTLGLGSYGSNLTACSGSLSWSGCAPEVTTQAESDFSNTSATGNGTIDSDGGNTVTACGVAYATTQNPTTSNSTAAGSSCTGGSFTANMTGLTASTTYYVRAYATNSQGTAYGSQVSFTTTAVSTQCDTYTVGQTGPGGGTIFYISGSGSSSTCYAFAPSTWDGGSDPTAEWCNGYEGAAIETGDSTTYGPTGNQDIGQGAANTATMLANSNCTAGAAHLASGYTGGGYSDWFLPSVAELTEIYDYYNSNGDAGGFTSNYYWSSSERSSTGGWYVTFSNGSQGGSTKSNAFYVRPLRAF